MMNTLKFDTGTETGNGETENGKVSFFRTGTSGIHQLFFDFRPT